MKKSRLLGPLFAAVNLVISLSSHAALIGILPATPGGTDWQAIYDEDRDISWIADANLAASNTFGLATGVFLGGHPDDTSVYEGIIFSNGKMNWPGTLFWIDAMNNANYLDFNNWRLPTTLQPDASCSFQFDPGSGFPLQGSGSGCTGSEMGHLNNVESVSYNSPDPFYNLQPYTYWSATVYEPLASSHAWYYLAKGAQNIASMNAPIHALAVHPGNIGAVPEPAVVWLICFGLLGLNWISGWRK